MAYIGDKGRAMGAQRPMQAHNPFTRSKAPVAVDVHLPDAQSGTIFALTTRGAPVRRRRADGDGVHFYDMDDGDYLAYAVFDGTVGAAWHVNVLGTVVTATPVATGGGGVPVSWSFG